MTDSDAVVELMDAAIERATDQFCELSGSIDRPQQTYRRMCVSEILSALSDAGLAVLPRKATRQMTIVAEQMGAGEAWAEDAWIAMRDAFHSSQLETKDE